MSASPKFLVMITAWLAFANRGTLGLGGNSDRCSRGSRHTRRSRHKGWLVEHTFIKKGSSFNCKTFPFWEQKKTYPGALGRLERDEPGPGLVGRGCSSWPSSSGNLDPSFDAIVAPGRMTGQHEPNHERVVSFLEEPACRRRRSSSS